MFDPASRGIDISEITSESHTDVDDAGGASEDRERVRHRKGDCGDAQSSESIVGMTLEGARRSYGRVRIDMYDTILVRTGFFGT